jgi:hypothetical protein
MAPSGASTRKEPAVPPPQIIPARITFVALDAPDAERLTFGPVSTYLEYCLLPLIGPSSYLLYRRVAALVARAGEAVVDVGQLSANLGLGAKTGPKSPIFKALARLELFGLGAWRQPDRYAVRLAVAPLAERRARRLPEPARTIHNRTIRGTDNPPVAAGGCPTGSQPTP